MKKTVLTLAISALVVGSTAHVNAAGFQLAEFSATGQGRAFAGEAAMADNASAQGRNPAMLSYLEGQQFSAGGIYVMPNVDVNGDIYLSSPVFGPAPVMIQADAKDVADDALVPNFYYSHQLDANWTLGVALNSNYGLATETPENHAAAIFGSHTSVKTVELNPNIAYRLNDAISLGAGVRFVYGEGKISASAPAWIDAIRANPNVPAVIAGRLPPAGTELKSMEGDDISYGWTLGSSWQINPQHRLGLAYHSGVELELDGSASGLSYTGGRNVEIDGYLPLEIPAFAELASYHELTDKFAIHTSVNWTQWSVFERLVAFFPGDVKPVGDLTSDLVKEENFKDNWRFALGSTYQLNNAWLVRGGVALDQTAVDDEHRTTTIPDSDRLWYSLGAGYQATEKLNLDFSVTYIRIHGDAPINEIQSLPGLAQIDFDGEAGGDVWLVGMQMSYKL
jgi:long-chain fatty acid transport protein